MKTLSLTFTTKKNLQEFLTSNKISDNSSLLIQVFTNIIDKNHIKTIQTLLNKLLPNSFILGSTTNDIFINGDIIEKNNTVLTFTQFDASILCSTILKHSNNDSFNTGVLIAKDIIKDDTKAIITFTDGLNTNGEEYLKGIQSISCDICVAGGMAGDNNQLIQTYVFDNSTILENGAVAISLNSQNLIVNTNYSFNWIPIGKKMVVTQSDKNRVYEIDHTPTREIYQKYFGKEISERLLVGGIEAPLTFEKDGVLVGRAVVEMKDDGSVTYAGNIQKGTEVRFSTGNSELILNDSVNTVAYFDDLPVESLFVYSCTGRHNFLGDKIQNELKPLSTIVPFTGFFTYGEFFSSCSNNELLNETLTILALSETSQITHKKSDAIDKSKMGLDAKASLTFALSNFINEVTHELESLNNNLEQKVKKKTKENIHQEKLLMQMSKQAAFGQMMDAIAHQWKQPLSAISTLSSGLNLQSEFIDDITELKKLISKTNEQTLTYIAHLEETINEFRKFFRPHFQTEDENIKALIDSVLDLYKIFLTRNNINVEITGDKDISYSLVASEFKHVIINFLTNANDAFEEHQIENKNITFDLAQNENEITITVTDNAGGVNKKIINDIFKPNVTTKEAKQGTGIGLYMSNQIIDKINGEIKVENIKNKEQQKGAKFTITLPLS